MSKKMEREILNQEESATPFFAHLLSSTESPSAEGGEVPTYHCLDSPCTKKYPSDGDEPTSSLYDR
jgi:hypothetical protein